MYFHPEISFSKKMCKIKALDPIMVNLDTYQKLQAKEDPYQKNLKQYWHGLFNFDFFMMKKIYCFLQGMDNFKGGIWYYR